MCRLLNAKPFFEYDICPRFHFRELIRKVYVRFFMRGFLKNQAANRRDQQIWWNEPTSNRIKSMAQKETEKTFCLDTRYTEFHDILDSERIANNVSILRLFLFFIFPRAFFRAVESLRYLKRVLPLKTDNWPETALYSKHSLKFWKLLFKNENDANRDTQKCCSKCPKIFAHHLEQVQMHNRFW